MKRGAAVLLTAALVAVSSAPTAAYLKLGTRVGTRTVTLKWTQFPIRYFVTDRGTTGVTSTQVQQAVQAAFSTWEAVPSATMSSQFVGFTLANPVRGDGATVLGFQSRPDLERTLGATSFIIDSTTGAVIESDIFFNTAFPWSVSA